MGSLALDIWLIIFVLETLARELELDIFGLRGSQVNSVSGNQPGGSRGSQEGRVRSTSLEEAK